MSQQLILNVIERLQRVETMLAKALNEAPRRPKRMSEEEVIKWLGIGRARLKQYRLGYTRQGKSYDPILFKWGHRNGRHIDYDVAELEEVFKQTIITNI